MPLYDLKCDICGSEVEKFVPLDQFCQAILCDCGGVRHRVIGAPRVMSDIEPYQAMGVDVATGKRPMITSRSEHRDYLKRNGFVEYGNDKPTAPAAPKPDKDEIARAVKRVMDEKGIRA